MFRNDDHPENKKVKNGYDFLKNERDVAKLANHIANLTEHIVGMNSMMKLMSQEIMMQRRAFNHLKNLIIQSNRDDEDEDDFPGLI